MIFNDAIKIIDERFSKEQILGQPLGLYQPIDYTLKNGGKRLRPALVLMATSLFGGNYNSALKAALGIEIFHNFTLLHDDIMDKAPIRRGKPTVHEKWDDNTAILSGDAMLIKAYQYVAQVPHSCINEVFEVFSQTALEVCEGQQYDMEFEARESVGEEEYLEMIRLKTAVLLGGSLKIGAIIGGASLIDQAHLYDFGINLGLAFQLMDDWLDVFGDEKSFGKKPGGDIASNKKTFLLINALKCAKTSDLEALNYWLNKTNFDRDEKAKSVSEIFQKLHIGELTKEKMEWYYQQSLLHLSLLSVSADEKESLLLLARQMMKRSH